MYGVWVEYDGCSNEAAPRFKGTHEQCLNFMRRRRAPKHCTWSLVSTETGRAVSYML